MYKLFVVIVGLGMVWEGFKVSVWLVNQPSDLMLGGGILLALISGFMGMRLLVWGIIR